MPAEGRASGEVKFGLRPSDRADVVTRITRYAKLRRSGVARLGVACLLLVGLLAGCAGSAQSRKPSAPVHREVAVGSLRSCGLESTDISSCPPSELSLIVVPHPDDEISAWSLIEGTPTDYKVFIDLTQGEAIGACGTSVGKTVYERTPNTAGQVPGSDPPGGSYAPGINPWVGTVQEQIQAGESLPNPACRQARFGSQVSFINKEAAFDPSLPSFPNSPPTEWCFPSEPNGKDPCFEVLATNTGAIVSFDLGDADWCSTEIDCAGAAGQVSDAQIGTALAAHPYAVQPSDVAWAVQNVAQYASTILPVSLPVGKIIGSGFLNLDGRLGTRWDPTNSPIPSGGPPDAGRCLAFGQPQHWSTETALRDWTLVPDVLQYGRTCSGDSYAVLENINPATYRRLMGNASTNAVDGEWPTSYGWLYGTSLDPPDGAYDGMEVCNTSDTIVGVLPAEGVTSCDQAFFENQGPSASVDYLSPTAPQPDPQGPWDYSHGNWRN